MNLELNGQMLRIGETEINIGDYRFAVAGLYLPREIEERRSNQVFQRLHSEGYYNTDGLSLERVDELVRLRERRQVELNRQFVHLDAFTKYLKIESRRSIPIDYEKLQRQVSAALPTELGLVSVCDKPKDFRKMGTVPPYGIEIMVANQVGITISL